jgi:hypothetical protein
MSFFQINKAGVPLNNINGGLVNVDSSNVGGIAFTNNKIPNGPQTLAAPGGKVLSAEGIYPCASQKGGKINRKKINKISRKYKMKGSKRTVKRRVRKMKSRVRSRYNASRRHKSAKGGCWGNKKGMKGGNCGLKNPMMGGATPAVAPNYPPGYNQYQNNNGALSNVYSTGGPLSAGSSALATPPPHQLVASANIPDNLSHAAVNAYGNYGAGSGFASRGWF